MERVNYLKKIRERIDLSEKGSVFIISDFTDIAEYMIVKKSLSRLEKSNVIRRVMRGVYEYPEYNDFLGEYIAVSPDKVSHALARNYGWTIVPCGDTALNMLGLSTQVPATWSYVSDGSYKKYEFDNVCVEFKKRTNREISGLSAKTALIIQALKTIGEDKVDEKAILKLSKKLNKDEKNIMLTEAKNVTAWVYEIVKRICKD